MSDSRRRRKAHHSGDSDLSDSYDELNVSKTLSSEPTEDHHDSEYDTAGSDSETESQEGVLRENGDGQEEEKPQRKLDDDEDRRNPQYIPKRGTFYEHDDRTAEEVTESTAEPQVERETKEKKVWKDKEDKWNHDRYNDDEQAPKSHDELIAVYGYDIRNEEGPPRARRRRRYGRGPNKYTRNWEDEDAYGKVSGSTTNKLSGRKSKGGEDFPALGISNDDSPKSEEPVISSAWFSNKAKSQGKANFPPLQPQHDTHKSKQSSVPNSQLIENKISYEKTNQGSKKDTKFASYIQSSNGNTGGGDADKSITAKALSRDSNKRQVQESASLAASRARGRGFKPNTNNNVVNNRVIESKPKGRGPGPMNLDNRRINTIHHEEEQQLINDVKHMKIVESTSYHPSGRQNKHFYAQSPSLQRANAISPRLQQSHSQQQHQPAHQPQQVHQQQPPPPPPQDASGNRPKRYSSLRQRPAITEGPGQQNYQAPHGQHTYYPPQAGSSRAVIESQGYPQGPFEQTPPVAPPTASMAGQPVIPMPPAPQPPTYAAPPPFLVPPPQFMPPQTAPPNIINYVPGPNGPAFQPNYQGYQGYNPAPVQPQGPPPPQELFQPQGCTYYSPAQQQQHQQPVRRPKAAIPILPPPDNQQQYQATRGRSKNSPQQQHHQQNELQQQYQQAFLEQQQELQQQHYQQELQHHQELQQQHLQQEIQQPEIQQSQDMQDMLQQRQQEVQEHQMEEIEYHQEIQNYEKEVQQPLEELQLPQKEQKLYSPEPLKSQEINLEGKSQTDDECHPDIEKYEIKQVEDPENVNVVAKEAEQVEKVLVKEEKNLIETIEKKIDTSEVVDSVSDSLVKYDAPVVDQLGPPSEEAVINEKKAESVVLDSKIVEETAA